MSNERERDVKRGYVKGRLLYESMPLSCFSLSYSEGCNRMKNLILDLGADAILAAMAALPTLAVLYALAVGLPVGQ